MTREEYIALEKKMRAENEAYEAAEPIVSDYEYDMQMQALKRAEREHPEYKNETSPSETVGAPVRRKAGVTVTHDVPMLSIEDVFTREDVLTWVHEVRNMHPDAKFRVEHKIDGLSMSIRYADGKMVLAETRGDGYIGEDVTLNAGVIDDVVKDLPEDPGPFEVRGEVYMTLADFERTNENQEKEGKKTFANPRNCAAGTLRQLDPKETRKRKLSMFIFNVQKGPDFLMQSHDAGLDWLSEKEGMPVVPGRLCTTDEEILSAIDAIGESRGDLGYDIDGAVVKIDQIAYRNDFPAGAKYSAGHIAYKYPPEEKETVIRDIEVSVGMTGRLNPTAVFDPIRLCGTTVSRATLHNQDFIRDLHIGIGDTVIVYKSGEIIPKIRASVPEKRPEGVVDFKLPDFCPACGAPVYREEGSVDVRCVNPECPAQLVRHLVNFVGRDAMDIKGFGVELIQKLADEGYVKDVADLYDLKNHRDELIEKGTLGREKNTDKLLSELEASKTKEPWRLLAGLAIPNVGKTGAIGLMTRFSSIDDLANASEEALTAVPDVGEITARCIFSFFKRKENVGLLVRLRAAGLNMTAEKETFSTELQGLTFVVTGDVAHFKNRNELSDFVRKHGGKVAGSVSKKTTALINNDANSTSGKNTRARSLGIPILTEEEFLKTYQLK
ncbi:MAG: NAD-dependent DNA ligase LigA [Lachnospiraceae bacterium]|nr:NAD-dependent DNA ligase LigA [Lachnospiraceae bacterium]